MRLVSTLLALAVLAPLAAGCGQTAGTEGAGDPESAPAATTATEQPVRPPDVLLVTPAGEQRGVLGSFCLQGNGSGVCADGTAPTASRLTVVAPGAPLTIRLAGARAVKAKGCHARDQSCIGEAHLTPFGCPRRTIGRVFLEQGRETLWAAPTKPGIYELQVFVYVEDDAGRTGDVTAALGLRIDPEAEPAIVPAGALPSQCR